VAADIDAEIEKELNEMRKPTEKELFLSVKLDTPCCQSPPLFALYAQT
jgi:hypothetical protein